MQPNGYATYILAALAVIGGGAGYFLGWVDGATAVKMVYAGLAVFGIRKSIANQGRVGGSHW